jgi:hypothetical protein
MKTEIINELDDLMQLSKDLENTYIKNRLKRIKKMLMEEWNETDFYYEQIKKELRTEETMDNLNDLMNFKK